MVIKGTQGIARVKRSRKEAGLTRTLANSEYAHEICLTCFIIWWQLFVQGEL